MRYDINYPHRCNRAFWKFPDVSGDGPVFITLLIKKCIASYTWTHTDKQTDTENHRPAADQAEHRWHRGGGHSGPVWEAEGPSQTHCCCHHLDLQGQTKELIRVCAYSQESEIYIIYCRCAAGKTSDQCKEAHQRPLHLSLLCHDFCPPCPTLSSPQQRWRLTGQS